MDSQVISRGPSPENAETVLILLHGRGASAESILSIHDELDLPGVAALAPQAPGGSWYPYSFLAPIQNNQPALDGALGIIGRLIKELKARKIESKKIALLGFSQGACLASEYAARNPQPYKAIMALTGGVIGPPGTERNYSGSFGGTPVFLGSSLPDAHVPEERVKETGRIFTALGAKVDLRFYPGMPHMVNEEELEVCRTLLE